MQQLVNQTEQDVQSREKNYLDYLEKQRKYYSDCSKAYKRYYQSLLLFSTVGAIIVPILIAITEVPKFASIIISGLVSRLCCKKSGKDAMDVKAHLPVQLRQPLQTGGRERRPAPGCLLFPRHASAPS